MTLVMLPYINPASGNFVSAQLVVLNDKNEILLEMKQGHFFLPGGQLSQEQMENNKPNVSKVAMLHMDIAPFGEEYIGMLNHEEEDMRYECHYYLCKHWKGEVKKVSSHLTKLLWVEKNFAKNLLSTTSDKEALGMLK